MDRYSYTYDRYIYDNEYVSREVYYVIDNDNDDRFNHMNYLFPAYEDILEETLFNIALRQSLEATSSCYDRKEDIKLLIHECKYDDKLAPKGETCSICMEDFTQGENISVLDCGHIFHFGCIDEWGKRKAECALCRKAIKFLSY